MNDQFGQFKLEFDVVLEIMGLPNVYYILSISMRSTLMQPQPMRLISNESSVNMIGPFILIFSPKAILS